MNNQMNSAVRKIHNLLSSGAVTVTGPNQPRILKQRVGATTITTANHLQYNAGSSINRCYVCDEALGASQAQHQLNEIQTTHTSTKFPNKIGQLVGDAFMVIVNVEDVVCSRCTNLVNYLDRLENDVERVRTNLMNLLNKKYGLNDDIVGGTAPPSKLQKLNSGNAARGGDESPNEPVRTRKGQHNSEAAQVKQSLPASLSVQQMKIAATNDTAASSTQMLQRKTTRIYKCQTCDYKTSDMRLFNLHYETCKLQNFQCKNCKKIFPNFGAMKQHMVREHNMSMDNTCSVCHYNYMNEPALRKHMEITHSTSVVVTSTLPASAVSELAAASLFTCQQCQFKTTDKSHFDEHQRKHLNVSSRPKPFKCRLCAQRFETRDAATIHAKQHQPNYFKCGTCSMSFPKRELLVKHFEVHQTQVVTPSAAKSRDTNQQHQQSPARQPQQLLTTQKLLQESIDEALNDSVVTSVATSAEPVAAATEATTAANNIRFFSCHICSLTFLQEHYYNQHMETHRLGEKKVAVAHRNVTNTSTTSVASSLASLGSAAALLSDGLDKDAEQEAGEDDAGIDSSGQQSSLGADIESIFEKMHSDKNDATSNAVTVSSDASVTVTTSNATSTTSTAAAKQSGDNLVITSQEGGITFNITIPQPTETANDSHGGNEDTKPGATPVAVSIDMPELDQPEEAQSVKRQPRNASPIAEETGGAAAAGPVSMPSLDDDNETQEQNDDDAAAAAAENDETVSVSNLKLKQEIEDVIVKTEPEVDDDKGAEFVAENTNDTAATATATDATESASNTVTAAAAKTASSAENAAAAAEGGSEAEAATPEQLSAAAGEQPHQVAMELDEAMHAQVESGQIKFILNEDGQLLQLDNHIITDADGNQILVQDPEQIQQLLQSVGVLQSGDGLDGETLQMMTDANGQMVLVQGEHNETQLIDASLLNAEGQLVIQQGQDGDMGPHVIGEDGTRIPVSVSYTADGQPIVQVQQQVLEATEGDAEAHDDIVLKKEVEEDEQREQETAGAPDSSDDAAPAAAAATAAASGGTGGGFFALEELMQQSSEAAKVAAVSSSSAE